MFIHPDTPTYVVWTEGFLLKSYKCTIHNCRCQAIFKINLKTELKYIKYNFKKFCANSFEIQLNFILFKPKQISHIPLYLNVKIEVVIPKLHIVYSKLTHSYSLKGELQSEFVFCNRQLTKQLNFKGVC